MIEKLLKQLEKVEKNLEKCRAKEYDLPWQSQRRAKMSVHWDYYAKEKMAIKFKLEELGYEATN